MIHRIWIGTVFESTPTQVSARLSDVTGEENDVFATFWRDEIDKPDAVQEGTHIIWVVGDDSCVKVVRFGL